MKKLTCSFLVSLFLVGLFLAGCDDNSSKPAVSQDYTNGYTLGYAKGEKARNFGQSNFTATKQEVEYGSSKPADMPKMGTPAYGDYMKGFSDGYHKGNSK